MIMIRADETARRWEANLIPKAEEAVSRRPARAVA